MRCKHYLTIAGVILAAGIAAPALAAGESGKLGVSMPTIQGPWYTALLYGVTDEASKLGYETVILDAGGYANVDNQVSQVSNLAVQQVKAILMDPANPTAFNAVVKQIQADGIPVLGAGSPIVASEVEANAAASSSHCNIGIELAKGAKQLLPNGGRIAALSGPPGAFWSGDRWRCFKEQIAGSNIEIVAEQNSEQEASVALALADDFLQRYPDIDLLYGADDLYGVAAARAVQTAGKCGEIKVLFAVLGPAAEEMMRAGCLDYVVAQQPVAIGRQAVQLADTIIKGGTPDPKLVEIPLVQVTPGNLDSVDKSTMQQPPGWTP
jgi:ABC-type sugar transport system substrate-binding protein